VIRQKSLILGLGLLASLPAGAAGDPFSEHEAMLCAVGSAFECDPEGGCQASTPDAVNFARWWSSWWNLRPRLSCKAWMRISPGA
jgi:hypothetical protein